ncbi:MAG: hypothetical protein K2P58_13480 [Hyphomonadaceae bacterium]|nr:hypothetical protein [Hyphomonadaceae bacterium]
MGVQEDTALAEPEARGEEAARVAGAPDPNLEALRQAVALLVRRLDQLGADRDETAFAIAQSAMARLTRIEEDHGRLEDRLASVERQLRNIKSAGQEFWRSEALSYLAATSGNWTYEATEPNLYFEDLFDVDVPRGQKPRRWVGRSGKLSGELLFNRTRPARLGVQVAAFALPSIADTLQLSIDGERVAWESTHNRLYVAVVPPASTPGLSFELCVDMKGVPPEKDVSFAFERIWVQAV